MNTNFTVTRISRIILVGKGEYTEKISQFPANLSVNELIFRISGETTVCFGKKVLKDLPNTIRFLPEGNFEKYIVDREEAGECILIAFNASEKIADEAFVLNVINAEQIKALFKRAFSIWVSKRDGYYFECLSILYKILAELQKEIYIPQLEYKKIKPAVDFIENNFLSGDIRTEQLTRLCGISQSYLNKIFCKKFGMSPKKYANTLKINYACSVLRSNTFTVSEVAQLCNYSDIYFFSKQFKKYMGISPTEYVKKYVSSK